MSKGRKLFRTVLALLGLAAFAGFVALGSWQVERRAWKLDLIDRVEKRVNAPPVAAPPVQQWDQVARDSHEYLHVSATGHFLDQTTKVTAATELGSGYWVLSPLRRKDGSLILINRGYVGPGVEPAPAPEGAVTVTGLLRMPEPGGGVLRDNEPGAGRWYSRDVAAIATAADLGNVAPYFIDAAEGAPGSSSEPPSPGNPQRPGNVDTEVPVGGLTVISFHNSHLVYAITWYGLALMVLGAAVLVWREERKSR